MQVAEHILGPKIQSLQGKTPRKTPSAVNPPKVSSLPNLIKLKYIMIKLCADIMFVNGVRFFMTFSQNIGFGTSDNFTNAKTATLVQSLLQVKRLYKRRRFKIQTVMKDGQFEFTTTPTIQECQSTQHQDMSTSPSLSVIYAPSNIGQYKSGQPSLSRSFPSG